MPQSFHTLSTIAGARRLRASLLGAAVAAALALPSPAVAQFTTGVAPPQPRAARTPDEVIAVERARADTVAIRERLDLRAWVDSAAMAIERGESPVAPIPVQPGDTLGPTRPAPAPARPVPTEPLARRTTVFREGAPAPATATPLPVLLLAGAGLLAGGAFLRRRR